MKSAMGKTCLAVVVLMMVSGGLHASPVVLDVNYDGYVVHNGGYNGLTTTGHGRLVGAWDRASDGAIFEERGIFKWNMSTITEHVDSAVVTFNVHWTSLTDPFAGDITISTFTTANNGDVVETDSGWNGATPIAPTASKLAFASTTGSPDGTYVTPVSVDVKDWLNAAIDGGLSYFSVRLSADYLFVDPALSALTPGSNPVSYILGGGYYPATLTYTVPEPATLMCLGLGIAGMLRYRHKAL